MHCSNIPVAILPRTSPLLRARRCEVLQVVLSLREEEWKIKKISCSCPCHVVVKVVNFSPQSSFSITVFMFLLYYTGSYIVSFVHSNL